MRTKGEGRNTQVRREEKGNRLLGNRVGLLSDVNSLLEASSCEFYLFIVKYLFKKFSLLGFVLQLEGSSSGGASSHDPQPLEPGLISYSTWA